MLLTVLVLFSNVKKIRIVYIREGTVSTIGGKLILNLSNVMTKIPKETLINFANNINKVISENISKYGDNYINDKVCYELDVSKIGDYLSKELFSIIIMHNHRKKILNIILMSL